MRAHTTVHPAWPVLLTLSFFAQGAGAATSHPAPRTAPDTPKSHLHTGNAEALRKVIQAPARSAPRTAGTATRSPVTRRPVIPSGGSQASQQPLSNPSVGTSPRGMSVGHTARISDIHTRPMNHPGVLGGAATASTLTPIHRAPATPVALGGAPSHPRVGFAAISGNAFPHKP